MPNDWRVGRPNETCCACSREFEIDEYYFSALFEKGADFERRDFCTSCWERERPAPFSFWRTRRPRPEEKRKLLVDDDVILNFFLRLEGADEPERVNLRYIVALILMRKRILKFETAGKEGETDYWVLRLVRDKTHHRVVNPHLSDEEIDELSQQVGDLLNMDVD